MPRIHRKLCLPLAALSLLLALPAAASASGSISGTATGADTGAPIAGLSVCAEENFPGGVNSRCTRTDPAGRYLISDLPAGTNYQVEFSAIFPASPLSYLTQFWQGKEGLGTWDRVTVAEGSSTDGIDALMKPGAQIAGHLSESGTGAPLAGVRVCVLDPAPNPRAEEFERCETSDAAGNYAVRSLPAGTYIVAFAHYPPLNPPTPIPEQFYAGATDKGSATSIALTPPESKTGIDATLTNNLRATVRRLGGAHLRTPHRRMRVGFRFFVPNFAEVSFACRLDGRAWRFCSSPHHFSVGLGRHVFRVRAVTPAGTKGPVISRRFRVRSTRSRSVRHGLKRPVAPVSDRGCAKRCRRPPALYRRGFLDHPADVEFNPTTGELLVADHGSDRIRRFGQSGVSRGDIGVPGSGAGQLDDPSSVAVDSSGDIWIADSGNHRLQKFDPSGRFILQCGEEGAGGGDFSRWGPKAIAIDADDRLWVTDYSGRVQQFDRSCAYRRGFGSSGNQDGQFIEAAGIDLDRQGRIWVSDWITGRVQVFTPQGDFLFGFGTVGAHAGQFRGPDGIEIDGGGSVWILDGGNSRIQRYDESGIYRGKFGRPGPGRKQFAFAWPSDLGVDASGHLWIADSANDRVQRRPFSRR